VTAVASPFLAQPWLMIAAVAATTLGCIVFFAEYFVGDNSRKLVVASAFAPVGNSLQMEFRYLNSKHIIATREAGVGAFQVILSGINSTGCTPVGVSGQQLAIVSVPAKRWLQGPVYDRAAMEAGKVYQVTVPSGVSQFSCDLAVQPQHTTPDTRQIRFLHSLHPSDKNWYSRYQRSTVDRFVLDDVEAQNVRSDDLAAFMVEKHDPITAANLAGMQQSSIASVARQESEARFEWTDETSVRSKEILFFFAGLLSAIVVSCLIEYLRPKTIQRGN
jgi:hypothetical protein